MPNERQFTDWFPSEVDPVHIGWYPRQRDALLIIMDFWNGHRWIVGDINGDRHPQLDAGRYPWRGLVEPWS